MERFYRYSLTSLVCLVAGLQFVQVVTRYALEIPLMGLEEIMVFPTLWMYMLGSVNASRENTQIRANVLEIFIKTPRGHLILAIVGDILSLIVLVWLNYWAWDFIKYSWRVWRESPTLYIPVFFSDIALLVGLVLMALYTLMHLVRRTRELAQGGADNG